MDGSGPPPKLLSTLSKAAEVVRGHNYIHLYSHWDADGIAQMQVVAKALVREGIGFYTTNFPVLGPSQMDYIRSCPDECVIITDLGQSYIRDIDSMGCDAVVLDHHTLGETETERAVYANPLLYGIDGTRSACASSLALMFAVTLNERNWDLAPVAFAGIVGDKQHLGGLTGLNVHLYEGASRRGYVTKHPGSYVPSGDLSSELYANPDPYIIGITDDSDGTEALLRDIGAPPGARGETLDEATSSKLSAIIASRLISQGVSSHKMAEALRERFRLKGMNMDAERFSAVIDVCGRNDQASVGLAAAMGDADCLRQADEMYMGSRRGLLDAVRNARENLVSMENIQWFDATETGSTGRTAEIIMSYIGDPSKVTVGFNGQDQMAKLSSRATFPLLDKGVNMAIAMDRACTQMGGFGGGHPIAAGGAVPVEKKEEFFALLDSIVGSQKSS